MEPAGGTFRLELGSQNQIKTLQKSSGEGGVYSFSTSSASFIELSVYLPRYLGRVGRYRCFQIGRFLSPSADCRDEIFQGARRLEWRFQVLQPWNFELEGSRTLTHFRDAFQVTYGPTLNSERPGDYHGCCPAFEPGRYKNHAHLGR
jgi:hypothetical protein